jgi:hypothetical protein
MAKDMDIALRKSIWWDYIEEDLKELLLESVLLIERTRNWNEKFHDYAFVVFPAAKAYEGFLKKLLLDVGFISEEDYLGKRFRIGKALNPALEKDIREREGVYDKLVEIYGGKELADKLWDTWKSCRNLLFHWFPNERNAISLEEAEDRIWSIINAMDLAYKGCKMDMTKI